MKRPLLMWLGGATLLALLFRAWGFWSQPFTVEDLLVGPTALGYLTTGATGPVMPFHPHLRDLVLGPWVSLFGAGMATRIPSILLGTACIPLLGILVHRLSKSTLAAGIAALLLAIDPVSIYFSRQSIQEVWTACFALAGVLVVVIALQRRSTAGWGWLMPLAGLLFGLGVSAKFYVVPVELAAIGMVLWVTLSRRRWPEAVFAACTIVGVSLLVYVLTFVPWMLNGHTAAEWIAYQQRLVGAMTTHMRPPVNHLRFNRPALWFVQPFMGWADVLYTQTPTISFTVGNPLVWLAVLPAAVYSLWKRRARRADVVFQVLFWATYLPLALGGRPIWLLSSVIVVPFAFALIALAATDLSERIGARPVYAYLGVATLVTALLFPAAAGTVPGYLSPLARHMGSYMESPVSPHTAEPTPPAAQ